MASERCTEKLDLRQPQLFRTDGPPLLTLITCAGPWVGTTYRDRLVVISRLDPIQSSQD